MTKILLSVLALTLCFTISSSYKAHANHFEWVKITADCESLTITGEVALLKGEFKINYSSLLTYSGGTQPVNTDIDISNPADGVSFLPFTLIYYWDLTCKRDVVLEKGTLRLVDLEYEYDSKLLPSPDPIYIGDCPCDEEVCDPRTQGFWKRICDGATSFKRLHPETPDNFDTSLCPPLQIIGRERSNPCVRAEAQFAALQFNIMYGYLSEDCEVTLKGFDTVGDVVAEVEALIAAGGARNCKKAADLAEAVNSGKAL